MPQTPHLAKMAAFQTPLLTRPAAPLPTKTRSTTPLQPPHLPTIRAVAEASAQTASKTPESFDEVVMNTYTRYPLIMSHGEGSTLYDTSSTAYLDCVAGIATCTLGHAHPAVVEAVSSQIRRMTHVSNLYYIPEQGDLARWLVDNSPMDRVFFCNSGAEANEAAIKLARKKWHLAKGEGGVPVIVTAKQSFHGRTIATLTATGQEKYHRNWGPLVPGFEYVTYNDVADLKALTESIGDNLCAIMLEAVQGEGGIHRGTTEFFKLAREICDSTGALLVCDEVQVGTGRTGKLWGFEHIGVQPDVFTTAKGLGGGVPIGAMCCQKHCDVFEPGDHASTFGGNPLASAAGMAIGRELIEGGVLENARERGEQLSAGLREIGQRVGGVKEVRGIGLIIGVEVEARAGDIVKNAMEKKLLLVPAGLHVVRFVPPLVITESEVAEVLRRFEAALIDTVEGV